MQNTFIGWHIRRANWNLLKTNALLVIVLVGAALLFGRYLFNFCFGPFVVERATVLADDNSHRALEYFIQVKGDQAIAMGDQIQQRVNKHTGEKLSESVTARYLAVRLDDRLLFVKAPADSAAAYSGALVEMPSEVRDKFLMTLDAPIRKLVFPFMLDATGFRGPGYWCLGLGVPLFLLGSWNLLRAWSRMASPVKHPIASKLERFGIPEEVAANIEQQADPEHGRCTIGNVIVMNSWLFRPTFFGLDVMHLGEVIWVYKKVTRHYTNGVLTETTTAAVMCDATGAVLEDAGVESRVDELLQEIYGRAPWILTGHNDEIENLWKTNRAVLHDAVLQRRQQVQEMLANEQVAEKNDGASESS